MSSEKYGQGKKDISIILAIRNEEQYIHKCLDSLINQNFAHQRYEIIVIDGMSDDNTRKIITEYQVRFSDLVRMFDNHKRIQAAGRNIGIEHARGEMIVIFDGHSYTHGEYLNTLIKISCALPSDVAGFGGVFLAPEDETLFGKIMADVQSSIVGGAGASFRHRTKNTYVAHVQFATYRKNIIEKIGLYDERFVIAEDVEFNRRIIKAGFKLMICPEIKVFYYRKHNAFRSFSVRMFRYGMWKALLVKKQPGAFKILFAIPTILLLSIILLPAFLFFHSVLSEIIITSLMIYLLAVLISSLFLVTRRRDRRYVISFPMYIIEHLSIGAGFLVGFFRNIGKKESLVQ